MSFYEALIIVGASVIRSVAGWLNGALEDGKITLFEWKELVKTTLRMGIPAFALYYGWDVPPEIAASSLLVVEYAYHYIKKIKEK